MNKLIKELRKFNRNIEILEKEIEVIKRSNFYTIFGRESWREKDILELQEKISEQQANFTLTLNKINELWN